jgi:hypothetical protein
MSSVGYQTIKISRGKHTHPDDGACVMELASMLAGERFTDHPVSVCPVIGSFLRAYNDLVDDDRRQDLYASASMVVGSRASAEVMRARAHYLTAWALQRRKRHWSRRYLPERWRTVGLEEWVPLYVVASYAIRSIWRVSDETHASVLAVIDGMLAIGSREGQASARTTIAGRTSGDYGYGGRRCFGVEWPHLGLVRADDAVGRFGHLVPDAGDVAEGLRDDQPRVV